MHAMQIGVAASPRTAAPSPHQIVPSNRKSQDSGLAAAQQRRRVFCQAIGCSFRPVVTGHGLEKFETIDRVDTTASTSASALSVSPALPLSLTGNVTLREILANAKLAKSTAYGYAIVPKYDREGVLVEPKKSPPFPWLPLPAPIVKRGKKLWNASDITAWFQCIKARANRSPDESETDSQMHREVTHGG